MNVHFSLWFAILFLIGFAQGLSQEPQLPSLGVSGLVRFQFINEKNEPAWALDLPGNSSGERNLSIFEDQ